MKKKKCIIIEASKCKIYMYKIYNPFIYTLLLLSLLLVPFHIILKFKFVKAVISKNVLKYN